MQAIKPHRELCVLGQATPRMKACRTYISFIYTCTCIQIIHLVGRNLYHQYPERFTLLYTVGRTSTACPAVERRILLGTMAPRGLINKLILNLSAHGGQYAACRLKQAPMKPGQETPQRGPYMSTGHKARPPEGGHNVHSCYAF